MTNNNYHTIKPLIHNLPIFGEHYDSLMTRTESMDCLKELLDEYGYDILSAIEHMIRFDNDMSLGIKAELLEEVGLIEEEKYHHNILNMLGYFLLNSSSGWIRDGAMRGISYLNDPKAVYVLRMAIKKEVVSELKPYMEDMIKRFEDDLQKD